MKRYIGISMVFVAVCTCSFLANATTLKCDNGVVRMTDSKYEITHKCGEPAYTDFSQVTRISKRSKSETVSSFVTVEDWLYNFGHERFVVVLTFESDKLIGMRSFGYGRSEGEKINFNKKVDIGDPSVRLLFLFGPPSYKEERVDTKVISRKEGTTIPKQKTIARWTYNLGPNRFIRIYHFVNGRLKKTTFGSKGF
jgi:Protein of unknown function (DUF2845)